MHHDAIECREMTVIDELPVLIFYKIFVEAIHGVLA